MLWLLHLPRRLLCGTVFPTVLTFDERKQRAERVGRRIPLTKLRKHFLLRRPLLILPADGNLDYIHDIAIGEKKGLNNQFSCSWIVTMPRRLTWVAGWAWAECWRPPQGRICRTPRTDE